MFLHSIGDPFREGFEVALTPEIAVNVTVSTTNCDGQTAVAEVCYLFCVCVCACACV